MWTIPLPLWEGLGEGEVEERINTYCEKVKK